MKMLVQSVKFKTGEFVCYEFKGHHKYVRVKFTNLNPGKMWLVKECDEKLIPIRDVIKIYNPFYDKVWKRIKGIFKRQNKYHG